MRRGENEDASHTANVDANSWMRFWRETLHKQLRPLNDKAAGPLEIHEMTNCSLPLPRRHKAREIKRVKLHGREDQKWRASCGARYLLQ